MPYLTILGVLGTLVRGEPHAMMDAAPPVWLDLHITIGVLVTGLLTVTAVTALGVALQERALKKKTSGSLSALLPSVNDSNIYPACCWRWFRCCSASAWSAAWLSNFMTPAIC